MFFAKKKMNKKGKSTIQTGTISSTPTVIYMFVNALVWCQVFVFMQQFSVRDLTLTLKCTTTASVLCHQGLTCAPEPRPVSSAFFSAPEGTSHNTSYKRASCQTRQICSCRKKTDRYHGPSHAAMTLSSTPTVATNTSSISLFICFHEIKWRFLFSFFFWGYFSLNAG